MSKSNRSSKSHTREGCDDSLDRAISVIKLSSRGGYKGGTSRSVLTDVTEDLMMNSFSVIAQLYLNNRTVCPKTARSISMISESCQEISSKKINAYLIVLSKHRSMDTVQKYQKTFLALWRWGWENGHITDPPRGVMKIQVRAAQVRAWTPSQLRQLMDGAIHEEDQLRSGPDIKWFMRAWIYLGYESGARMGDLWNMRYSNIEGDTLRWIMGKTGDPMYRVLSPACLKAVNSMAHIESDLILGRWCGQGTGILHMRTLLRKTGLPGSSKWLRRSGATHVEMETPGSGRLFLGHRSYGVADRHYFDRGQIQKDSVQVKSIFR